MMDSSVLDESREPLKLPAFEKAVMQSVTRALEQWRDEAMEGERQCLHRSLCQILCVLTHMHGIVSGYPAHLLSILTQE